MTATSFTSLTFNAGIELKVETTKNPQNMADAAVVGIGDALPVLAEFDRGGHSLATYPLERHVFQHN